MDLKSMLNDSAAQRPPPPRLHTSSSSISDRPVEQGTPYDVHGERATPHPQNAYSTDGRPSGSYFSIQSPSQYNSASTPSAGTQSTHTPYGQSPGPASHRFTPRRDNVTPQHVYTPGYIPPPSPVAAPPSTPGAQYYNAPPPQYGQPYHPHGATQHRPPTRDEFAQANGRASQPPAYQMSPPPPHPQQTPSTPLGRPPANYARPSVHSQRPPSQGFDHLRRASVGSVSSSHSRDPSMPHMAPADPARAGSAQRTHSHDEDRFRQDRDRSVESVSPKTIPRPPPQQRNSSTFSQPYERSPAGSVTSHTSHPAAAIENSYGQSHPNASSQQQPPHMMDARALAPSKASPGARPTSNTTPQSTHSSLPAQPSPPSHKPRSKKRTASVISTAPAAAMPPQKRIKREEKPIWAQSARKHRLVLDKAGPRMRPPRRDDGGARDIKHETPPQERNGHQAEPVQIPPTADESILPRKPRNDLIFYMCEWIYKQLANRIPPKGSVFEIEAKLGVMMDVDRNERVRLPVCSEAIFDRACHSAPKTRFDTSILTMQAHKGLNEFLNHTIAWNKSEVDRGSLRDPMHYAHTVEWDELYELNHDGKQSLQLLLNWMPKGHTAKVRRTFDKQTQALKAQIIKTRVADLDIYNPNDSFDYRISISLETPWDGPDSHLIMTNEPQDDRMKDRLSYKHRDYQIDLTQISQPRKPQPDHEVEIEINNDSIMAALDAAKEGRPERYEKLLQGFMDNIRILAGHASAAVQQPMHLGR